MIVAVTVFRHNPHEGQAKTIRKISGMLSGQARAILLEETAGKGAGLFPWRIADWLHWWLALRAALRGTSNVARYCAVALDRVCEPAFRAVRPGLSPLQCGFLLKVK